MFNCMDDRPANLEEMERRRQEKGGFQLTRQYVTINCIKNLPKPVRSSNSTKSRGGREGKC